MPYHKTNVFFFYEQNRINLFKFTKKFDLRLPYIYRELEFISVNDSTLLKFPLLELAKWPAQIPI